MKKLLLLTLVSVLTFSYQNCSNSNFATPEITTAPAPGGSNTAGSENTSGTGTGTGGTNTYYQKLLNVTHYYRGGWMPAQGAASFSHDALFNFLNSQNGYVQYKHTNGSTCLGDKTLSAAQIAEILKRTNSATKLLQAVAGPIRADGGVEYVDMSFSDASKLMAYIDGAEAPKDSLVIVNPDAGKALGDYLKAIIDAPETMANSSCVGVAQNFKSIRYFKSEYTTWQEGNFQYKGVKTLRDYNLNLSNNSVSLSAEMLPAGSTSCTGSIASGDINLIALGTQSLTLSKKSNAVNYVPEEGYEFIEITYSDDSKKKIHLKSTNATPASDLASSANLSSLLYNGLTLSCVK